MFISDNEVSYTKLIRKKNGLFIKSWNLPFTPRTFVQTILPGNIEGISGSSVG